MKIKLKSDFIDFYDHWFSGYGDYDIVFERYSNKGPSRPEMFELFKKYEPELKLPIYGKCKDVIEEILSVFKDNDKLKNQILTSYPIVIYHDLYSHKGENKELILMFEALEKYPEHFSSEYIPSSTTRRGTSIRYLRIGRKQFLLKYQSKNDWRSNCGDNEIKFLEGGDAIKSQKHDFGPLFAIDMIPYKNELYAIDLNISPQIKGTGIEDHLSGKEAYNLIYDFYFS